METVQPRNNPSSESMTQDNEQKMPTQMPGVENYAGNESGTTTLIGAPVAVNLDASFGINGTASGENLSAKFKNPQAKQDVPEAARGQYQ